MSLIQKIKEARTDMVKWQNNNLGVPGKDVNKEGVIYGLLSAGMVVVPALNIACDNGTTPQPEEDASVTVYARSIEPGDDPLIRKNNAKLILERTNGTHKIEVIDNGIGDLDDRLGVIKSEVPADKTGDYNIIVVSPGFYPGDQLSIFYNAGTKEFVTQNDTRGPLRSINIGNGDNISLDAYLMDNGFDLDLFRQMAQGSARNNYSTIRFNKKTPVKLWVTFVEGTTKEDLTARTKANLRNIFYGDPNEEGASLYEATGELINIDPDIKWGGEQPEEYPFHWIEFDKNMDPIDGLNGVSLDDNGYIERGTLTFGTNANGGIMRDEIGQASGMITDVDGGQGAILTPGFYSDKTRWTNQGKKQWELLYLADIGSKF